MQPEKLDSYASAMIIAALAEPSGLGFLILDDALAGRFAMPSDERVPNKDLERLLLIATVEELLGYELALREPAGDQVFLVFPAHFTRRWPAAPELPGRAVVFNFEGAAKNAYATLAVRLAHSQLFVKHEMWQNVATYRATVGGVCGIALREDDEGNGELTVFFEKDVAEITRHQFEQYVAAHLERHARGKPVARRPIFACGNCGAEVTEQQAVLRRQRNFTQLNCPVCGASISLLDRDERLAASAVEQARVEVARMDRAADAVRDQGSTSMLLKGKEASGDYDVFLSHNGRDKPAVRVIAQDLRQRGLLPWLDEYDLRPGSVWQAQIERIIAKVKAAVIVVGPNGFSEWNNDERMAFEREAKRRELPVIPLILPDVQGEPKLPIFLGSRTWVDFRKLESRPFDQLLFGITGKHDPMVEHEAPLPTTVVSRGTGFQRWLHWLNLSGQKP